MDEALFTDRLPGNIERSSGFSPQRRNLRRNSESQEERKQAIFEEIGLQESLKKVKNSRRCMFHPQGAFKIIWDLILILFVLWSCIYVPFDIAYGANDCDLQNSSTIHTSCLSQGYISISIIEYIIDIFFIVDVIVNFRTMLINNMTGEPIDNPKQIALSYIFKGRFIIDFLACIPFELFSLIFNDNKTYVKPIKLLKLSRLLRVGRIITYMKTRRAVKSSLKVITTILFLMLCIHWTNCLWYGTVDINQAWLSPKNIDSGETSLYSAGYSSRYIFIYCYAAQMVIGVDLLPSNQLEVCCCVIICITGPILLGLIISIFSDLPQKTWKILKQSYKAKQIKLKFVIKRSPLNTNLDCPSSKNFVRIIQAFGASLILNSTLSSFCSYLFPFLYLSQVSIWF